MCVCVCVCVVKAVVQAACIILKSKQQCQLLLVNKLFEVRMCTGCLCVCVCGNRTHTCVFVRLPSTVKCFSIQKYPYVYIIIILHLLCSISSTPFMSEH